MKLSLYHFIKRFALAALLLSTLISQPSIGLADEGEVFPLLGTPWKYLDDGTDQGTAWRGIGFDDSGWSNGVAELGFGDGDEATLVLQTNSSGNTNITFYFRHAFNVTNAAAVSNLAAQFKRDDGVIVYLNGTEVIRNNLPDGPVSNSTLATIASDDGNQIFTTFVSPGLLIAGSNVVAAEVHQRSLSSSDISFALGLFTNVSYLFPPSIITQPQSQTVNAGSDVTFTVDATGTEPLSYQWLLNSNNIPGATATSYSLTGVQSVDAGIYSVIVTNLAGSVTSSNAVLVVNDVAPILTTQPQSRTNSAGDQVTFVVAATGTTPLSYQWQLNGTNVTGATDPTYTLNPVDATNAGAYSVLVMNPVGTNSSSTAGLTVNGRIVTTRTRWNFNSVPPDAIIVTGVTAPMVGSGALAVIGSGVTTAFSTGSDSDPASLTTDNSGLQTSGYSSADPNKTAGVQCSQSTLGCSNILVTWEQRVSATASKYWRFQYTTNGSTYTDADVITMSANSVFEYQLVDLSAISSVNNNSNFAFRIVTEYEDSATGGGSPNYFGTGNIFGSAGTARFDLITVFTANVPPNDAPSVATQPQSRTNSAGDKVTFSVFAIGTAPLSYQWRFNGTNVAGATNSAYTLNPVDATNAGAYSVLVTNPVGTTASSAANLTVIGSIATTRARWDFNSAPLDTNVTTGVTTPAIGSGNLVVMGSGVTTAFSTGADSDPASLTTDNSGLQTSSYSSADPNKTAGVQCSQSTLGCSNILVAWEQRVSATASKYWRFQYTTNGSTYTDADVITMSANSVFQYQNVDLSAISSVNNNSNFAFRIVTEYEDSATGGGSPNYVGTGNTFGSAGTARFDLITVFGTTVPGERPSLLVRRTTTNTVVVSWPSPSTGFNLQVKTNLASTNWTGAGSPSDDGTNKYIIVSPPTGNRFYRLSNP